MSVEVATATSGGTAGGNGVAAGNSATTVEEKPEVVTKAQLDHALADIQKIKKERDALKVAADEAKTQKLKEQNDWKALAEAKEAEAKDAKTLLETTRATIIADRKYNAVLQAVHKLGIVEGAVPDLEMIDLSQLQIETTSTGKINVLGVDKFAERLKTTRPHWFAEKKPPNVDTSTTRVIESQTGEVTVAMLMTAEAEGKKTGDKTKYYELHKKFQQQRVAQRRR